LAHDLSEKSATFGIMRQLPKPPSEETMAHRLAGALFCGTVIWLFLIVALIRPDVAMAQGLRGEPRYAVSGFREARFGMTEQEVRMSAKASFRVDDGDMTLSINAIDGTTKLIVHVRMLESGLGDGRVEYFFGYKQHKLFQVNVVWGADGLQPSNNGLIAGAARLQRYFLGFGWATRSVRTGIPIDDRSVLLFSGADGTGRTVSLLVDDVQYQLGPNGIVRLLPERLSPTRVTISYTDEGSASDVRDIARGEF
jgi:hypothetical protein